MPQAVFDNRRKCHYPGDVRSAVGQVVGPNLLREMLVIESVDFDPETNTSTAYFRYATIEDMQRKP